MRKTRTAGLLLAISGGLVLALSANVLAAQSLVTVTGPSPYAGCSVGGTDSSTNYPNAEVEPYVAVNPANQNNVVGAWQQDRWNDGGSHGLAAGFSFDGGKTWGETTLPFDTCAPGGLPYERSSDPWVSIGPDGTAYANAIAFNANDGNNAVVSATSTDGGKTWVNAQTVITDAVAFNDKNSLTANPAKAGVAYQVWDRLASRPKKPDSQSPAGTGSTYLSMTTDGGKTWTTPQVIFKTASLSQTIGNQIVVDPAHPDTLYDFATWFTGAYQHVSLAFVKSTDGGKTWSRPKAIADMHSLGATDPNTGAAIRDGGDIPEPAIGPHGELYVVMQDGDFSGGKYDEVALISSTDGGATWTAPQRVNTPTGRAAWEPTVKVSADGTVGVTYYDFRNLADGNTTTLPTDYWFKSSRDGGKTWSADTHVAGSFDLMTAPKAGGYFLGDYQGLATSGASTFHPFFVAATCAAPSTSPCDTANRTDVYTTAITP